MVKKRIKQQKKIVKVIKMAVIVIIALVFIVVAYNAYEYFNIPVTESGTIQGVDVSSYQGDVDWKMLSEQDIAFAFIKATEGSKHVDKKFEKNWKEIEKSKIRPGAYHFLSYDSSGREQAKNFIETVGDKRSMLPPVVDVEFYGKYLKAHPSEDVIYNTLNSMLSELEKAYGEKPIIYTNTYIYETYLSGNYINDIWISDLEQVQPLSDGTEWTFCQYSFDGIMKGYSGGTEHIDLNIFNGSRKDFFLYH